MAQQLMIFGGSGSPILTRKICKYLNVQQGEGETIRFSEGNLFVRIKENVRGQRVYVIQSTAYPPNDNFMELLFWIDAFKRSSAESVTVVMPYFSYAKGDKKDEPRVAIRARVCADALEAAGADRIVTMDLHAPQIQGFFRIPVDDLYALPVLCQAVRNVRIENLVVIAPDAGFAKKGRLFATALRCSLAIADKERSSHDQRSEVLRIIGDVEGKAALIVDDFTISGGTLCNVAEALVARGATEVHVAISHAVFSDGAIERIQDSSIKRIFITDTVETQSERLGDKVEVVSVAPLFGEAIRRIHNKESISVLFEDP